MTKHDPAQTAQPSAEPQARQAPRAAADFFDVLQSEWLAAFPGKDVPCEPVMTRMTRLVQALERRVDAAFAPFGITRGEVEVLCAVARSPGHRLLPKDILQKMVVSSGGLTARIDQLEKRGALVRKPNPEDRRSAILEATAEGIELALAAHLAHVRAERAFIEGLSPEEQVALALLLKTLSLSVFSAPKPSDSGAS